MRGCPVTKLLYICAYNNNNRHPCNKTVDVNMKKSNSIHQSVSVSFCWLTPFRVIYSLTWIFFQFDWFLRSLEPSLKTRWNTSGLVRSDVVNVVIKPTQSPWRLSWQHAHAPKGSGCYTDGCRDRGSSDRSQWHTITVRIAIQKLQTFPKSVLSLLSSSCSNCRITSGFTGFLSPLNSSSLCLSIN